jgi:hypothetical protein
MGYMGAATGDVVTGYYSSPAHGGWQVAIYIWAGWAFAGAVITALLWNTTSRKIGVMHHVVPKVAGLLMLAVASAAITAGDQPLALRLATYAGTLGLLGTFVVPWPAFMALFVATAGLLVVFWSSTQSPGGVSWSHSAAMVAYGLTMITSLMVLVEKKDK